MEQTLTKEQLKEKLEEILENLPEVFEEEDGYGELLWQGFEDDADEYEEYFEDEDILCMEDFLAAQSVQHPELHGLIGKLVEQITENNEGAGSPLSVDSEWSAGAFFAARLATAKEEYIPLFIRHFLSTDPGHEEEYYQFWGICRVLAHYGLQKCVIPVLVAPYFADCSDAPYFLDQRDEPDFTEEEVFTFLEDEALLDEFLKALAQTTRTHVPYPSYPAYYSYYLFTEGFLSRALQAGGIDERAKGKELMKAYRQAVIDDKKTPTIKDIQGMIDAIA